MPECINFEIVDGEKRWTYPLKIRFNEKEIIEITITDYYQTKPGREMITNKLILELLIRMSGEILKSTAYSGKRKVYKWEKEYKEKRYRLFFWFKDYTTNHLWIRNIHPIDDYRVNINNE